MALVDTIQNSEHSVFRERIAHSSMDQSPTCWSELRHYAGRLLSFSHGIRTMILAAEAFPRLFENPEVVFIPASNPDVNPFQATNTSEASITPDNVVTSDTILRKITASSQMAVYYQALAEYSRTLSLDDIIQKLVGADTFRPIVHAELLILQSLEKDGLTRPSDFFNSWKYIGSSKPTCRLCHYYFRAHDSGFQVRPTHGNLYENWKPPDVYRMCWSSQDLCSPSFHLYPSI